MARLPHSTNVLRGSHDKSPSQFGSPSWSYNAATSRKNDLSNKKCRLYALTEDIFDTIDATQH